MPTRYRFGSGFVYFRVVEGTDDGVGVAGVRQRAK